MTENMNRFYELTQEDEALARQVECCTTTDELTELASAYGITLDSRDFRIIGESGELSDSELERVAGGSSIQHILKVFRRGKQLLFG